MDFRQLQSYVAVVEYKSFTIAAKRLFISQPTISSHVSALEKELGTRLLTRTTKNLEITSRGMELYETALTLMEIKDGLIKRWSLENDNVILLGASTLPSAYIMPQLLVEFKKLYPKVSFQISQGDSQSVMDMVLTDRCFVGLVGMECKRDNLECIPFCQDSLVIITPNNEHYRSFLEEGAMEPSVFLKSHPVILREMGSGSRKSADLFLEKAGVALNELNVVARVNDPESVKRLVAAGFGVSIISHRTVFDYQENKKILVHKIPSKDLKRNMNIIYKKDSIFKDYQKKFIDFTLDFFKNEQDSEAD